MIGLALSMGASSLLLPRQSGEATAAEPQVPDATRVSSSPSTPTAPAANWVEHVVSQGQTLWQISRQYNVPVEVIASANDLSLTAIVKTGDVVKVPLSSEASIATSPNSTSTPIAAIPQTTTNSSERSSLKVDAPSTETASDRTQQVKADRDASLNSLHQQQEKLRNSLASLRTSENSAPASAAAQKDSAKPEATKPAAQASTIAQPPQDDTYQVRSGDTLNAIARAHNVSEQAIVATNNLSNPDWLKVNQALTIPETAAPASATPATAVPPTSSSGLITQLPTAAPIQQAAVVPETVTPVASQSVSQPVTAPAAPTRTAQSVVPPTASVQRVAANTNSSADLVSYRVGPGDTLARIARSHNITPSELARTNRISDPNFIFVGQLLRVPAQAQVAQASETIPQTTSTQFSVERRQQQVAVTAPVAVEAPQVAVAPMTVVPPSANLEAPIQPVSAETANSVGGSDPYIDNLLSEIKEMRQQFRSTPVAAAPAAPVTIPQSAPQAVAAAPAAAQPVPAATLPSLSVGTRFNPRGLTATQTAPSRPTPSRAQSVAVEVPAPETAQRPASRTAAAPERASQPEMVAAAPAGSENYAPLLEPVTGRIVSPDLPPLQGEDTFLPEGAPAFNGYIWPAKGVFTSGYGWRWGRMHQGIDIAADVGTPIFAAADGVIEYSGWNSGGYGNLVEVRHADGSMTRYAHLDRSLVKEGQRVKQGEQIAEMGSTGYSTGPHLHFEIHLADQAIVNPMAYLPQQ
ncbi:MAG: LysM peptidoglycan-binding domain-containing protein [Oculatellaceae cyanobacterium Prado106]|nr:LysM peptidoglycan-binding domain-containing protein [Oculatellaceae cyanobacterium Prado106]